ncbi:dienelactone hydrolase family protein [Pelagibius sp. Alg239-R121]|uniref:dienelactone hydrolase family protein n=1 Tax=Pelagibius sp. Alg239-R121 TaxID=2993448 RepID=UPI0024A7239D|nr:dienelactone hydrolase family protein [Pelagibius sp. Alg239-R121]
MKVKTTGGRLTAVFIAGLLLSLLQSPAGARADVAATWQRSYVSIPGHIFGGRPILGKWRDRFVQRGIQGIPPGTNMAAIIFLHGCNGIAREEEAARLVFMEAGYATFFPDSFARSHRRSNCSVADHRTALAPEAHRYRVEEIEYALQQVRALPWIDQSRVFVMGFSEGGMAVANYPGISLAGLVITGWHCQGRPPNVGIKSDAAVPVLAILGGDDPWYAAKRGEHCGQVFNGRPDATSLVLPGNGHAIVNSPILENAERAKQAIISFLEAH